MRTIPFTAVALLCGALLLTACAAESTSTGTASPSTTKSTTKSPTKTPAETPTPSETPEPTQTPEPSPEPWVRTGDAAGPVSFELPPGWSLVRLPSAMDEMGVYQAQIVDASGTGQLYFLNQVHGLGGACTGRLQTLHIEEFDVTPVEIPGFVAAEGNPAGPAIGETRFVYRVSNVGDGAVASLALVNSTPRDACMYYNQLQGGPAGRDATSVVAADWMQVDSTPGGRVFATRAEADAFMQSDEYATLKRILLSMQLQV